MEIEVGDYVRTNSGLIFKVNEITYDEEYKDYLYKESFLLVDWKENIVKHSKQLIDLVEVGDYVNGKLIHKIDKGSNYCYLYYGNCKTFVDYQIKTILTKESYMANCYKVGGEEQCM